jgi:hypothetical protein
MLGVTHASLRASNFSASWRGGAEGLIKRQLPALHWGYFHCGGHDLGVRAFL